MKKVGTHSMVRMAVHFPAVAGYLPDVIAGVQFIDGIKPQVAAA